MASFKGTKGASKVLKDIVVIFITSFAPTPAQALQAPFDRALDTMGGGEIAIEATLCRNVEASFANLAGCQGRASAAIAGGAEFAGSAQLVQKHILHIITSLATAYISTVNAVREWAGLTKLGAVQEIVPCLVTRSA